jgi:hypothetical protein
VHYPVNIDSNPPRLKLSPIGIDVVDKETCQRPQLVIGQECDCRKELKPVLVDRQLVRQ